MKIYFYLAIAAILFVGNAQAAYFTPVEKPTVPDYLKVENFIKMTPKEFGVQSGHKLGLTQRIYFKKLQKTLRKSNVTNDANLMSLYNQETGKFRLDILWFILGAMIGPFAVLFSYTIRDRSKNKKISAWLGLAIFILWFGAMFIF